MKKCNKCDAEKSLNYFIKEDRTKDGYTTICKDCINSRRREYNKKYHSLNKDEINRKGREYSKTESGRKSRNVSSKKYYLKNKDLLNKSIGSIYRNSLKTVLKRLNIDKDDKTIELLGYSPTDFKLHLESLFEEGMSWSNHGEWHIDHIKPISIFEKGTPVSIINSLDNLQPLWAFDNLSKGDKF
jgi:hypothetical protein